MKNYSAEEMGCCPKCNSELTFYDFEVEGDRVFYYFNCECGCSGNEIYELNYLATCGSD